MMALDVQASNCINIAFRLINAPWGDIVFD